MFKQKLFPAWELGNKYVARFFRKKPRLKTIDASHLPVEIEGKGLRLEYIGTEPGRHVPTASDYLLKIKQGDDWVALGLVQEFSFKVAAGSVAEVVIKRLDVRF